jgi:hypothetical protein
MTLQSMATEEAENIQGKQQLSILGKPRLGKAIPST